MVSAALTPKIRDAPHAHRTRTLRRRTPGQDLADDIEPEAEQQLAHIARLAVHLQACRGHAHVHFGKGATVDSVIASATPFIPAAVGVDIGLRHGCRSYRSHLAISAAATSAALRHSIERSVPVGFTPKGAADAALEWRASRKKPSAANEPKALLPARYARGGNHSRRDLHR